MFSSNLNTHVRKFLPKFYLYLRPFSQQGQTYYLVTPSYKYIHIYINSKNQKILFMKSLKIWIWHVDFPKYPKI